MTELHDITVRYETVESIHTDTHEAARTLRYDDYLKVTSGVCGCCGPTETEHRYPWDNVVEWDREPSDHMQNVGGNDMEPVWAVIAAVLTGIVIAAIVMFVLTSPGGPVSL